MNFDDAVRAAAEGHLVKRPDWVIAMKVDKSPSSGEQYFVCDKKGDTFPLSVQDWEAEDFEVVKAVEDHEDLVKEIEKTADKITQMIINHLNSHSEGKSCCKCGKEKK